MQKGKLAFVTAGFLAGTISGFTAASLYRQQEPQQLSEEIETHVEPQLDKVFSEDEIRMAEILKYGAPDRGLNVRHYRNHALCYDQRQKMPVWVAEHLTADNLKGTANRKSAKFRPDPGIDAMFTAHNTDYLSSGWSRGHMAPAGDNKRDDQSMRETFYLSNILPQNLENNGGFWNRFEVYCRDLTKKYNHVRVISGPLFLPFKDENDLSYIKYQLIGKSQVAVPTHLYKVIVAEQDGEDDRYMGVFVVPNLPIRAEEQLPKYQSKLEILEAMSGLKFLPELDRTAAKDLCLSDGCKMIDKGEFDLWIYSRRLEGSRTEERLEKTWAEIKQKKLKPDKWMLDVYDRKKAELKKTKAVKAED